MKEVSLEIGGRTLTLTQGLVAKQANGSVLVRYADSLILSCACAEPKPEEGKDFLPLTVEYREKTYSAGMIPGGFIKREGRPSDRETLVCRLTDRPLRPLFPEGYFNDVQIATYAISTDLSSPPDVMSIIGASTALLVSDIPFTTAVGAVRVARLNGQYKINPSTEEIDAAELELVVAGTRTDIAMVEGAARQVSEDVVLEGLKLAQAEIAKICEAQETLRRAVGKPKAAVISPAKTAGLSALVEESAAARLSKALVIPTKLERYAEVNKIEDETLAAAAGKLGVEREAIELEAKGILEDIKSRIVRANILERKQRNDGRGLDDVRPIDIKLGFLPRAHGSALFTRGETQALAVVTLGTADDEQRMDDVYGERSKRFYLHYYFPPFSVGETGRYGGQGRREIGHGMLAEKSLRSLLPTEIDFPYAVRLVSDILESNGSSSMASVCGGSLALMDAGVPVPAHVAGVAMGLVKEGDRVAILTDILGDEDHLGDMDFKVAGTRQGVTAIQMDIKIGGISVDLMRMALEKANRARLHILEKMEAAISKARPDISPYAPRVFMMTVPKDKIGDIIGPGGKNIRAIIEETGVKIDIEDDGTVRIYSEDEKSASAAKERVHMMIAEPELGRVYQGKVVRVVEFGAFCELMPGHEGLCHISELQEARTERVEDVLKEGDITPVKLIEIDHLGRLRLSRVAAIREIEGKPPLPTRPRGGDRGDRDGDRGRRPDRGDRPRFDRGRSDRPDRRSDRPREGYQGGRPGGPTPVNTGA
ncbi:MAG: polyribonucleotide nucleotidyltransferase [Candidatus Lindowbacteria bacterium RIFCSPLOWO2_12_FULL_62_27]|nr:MAG: polyribonucleotide nucleotidyltransferase [Candidatus Lindowbacteria bacterium RIFCSPLOWO2_02_FULL_62_12]OGH62685.1 MAG: polyribonucleotide nucleotidyltransferase [Candidatus Lindowbacteria bacterium RIFCSPLOWO2_12_FULL_62_27]